jgi:N-methylhydantoinase A
MPGALSAYGAARADLEGDLMTPVYRLLSELSAADLRTQQEGLRSRVAAWLEEEMSTLEIEATHVQFAADMRYDGQGYDVSVPLEESWLDRADLGVIVAAFHDAHETTYGHRNEAAAVWLNELRAHVVGRSPKPTPAGGKAGAVAAAPFDERALRIHGQTVTAPVFRRGDLAPGVEIEGPAIVEQMDTTTVVPDGWTARVVASESIVLVRG